MTAELREVPHGERTRGGASLPCAAEGGLRTRGSASPPCAAEDARSQVPPVRRAPSKNSVLLTHDNRAVILFVTVVANQRLHLLDNGCAFECLLNAWRQAGNWLVGRFVVMPDHIHFFCSPATYPPSGFHGWMAYWKSLATKEYWCKMGGTRSRASDGAADARPSPKESSAVST